MTNTVNEKPVQLGVMQAHTKDLFNKGIGNEGTCSTAADTAAKEVTLGTTFELVSKATIFVTFTNGISVANATIAITHEDLDGVEVTETAKPIHYRGSALGANMVKAGDKVLLRYDGTNFNIVGSLDQDLSGKADKSATVSTVTYDTTNKKLTKTINGSTTDVVTAAKIVEDGGGIQPNLLDLASLSYDYFFKVNDALCISGVIYKCTSATTKPPFNFVFDANNSIVVDRINGQDAVVCDSDTLNTGWEKVLDLNDRYYVEKAKEEAKSHAELLDATLVTKINALTRHTRLTDFDLSVLKQAVADQNLEKYGLKVGDQKTINGHTYVIAGLNCMNGTEDGIYTTNHVGLIVIPHTTQAWNVSGNTAQGADGRGAGYKNSDLHYYLKNTLLPLVNTDLGAANLLGHTKMLSSAIQDGKASSWSWEADCKICALSEVQVFGSVLCGNRYDVGEACQQLEVFQHFRHTSIFGDESIWLRAVASASGAADTSYLGFTMTSPASNAEYVAALVLFH